MLGLVAIGFAIALRLAVLGFWLVLPFTLIELALVYYMVNRIQRHANYVEKIRIDGEQVAVFHLGPGSRYDDAQFPLYWVKVDLRASSHRWYPHRLLLGASGRWVEVGSCLTDTERGCLADAVRQTIARYRMPEHLQNA